MVRIAALRSFSNATVVMISSPNSFPNRVAAAGPDLTRSGRKACSRRHSGEPWRPTQPENPVMSENDAQRFVIVDLRIPFARLVLFFIKAALAAIPATIIVSLLLMLVTALIAWFVGDGGFVMMRRWSF